MNIQHRSGDRKDQIRQAALDLAFELGAQRVSTVMIADKLNLSQPAIYKHYKNKNDIWVAIADGFTSNISDNIQRSRKAAVGPDDRLRGLVGDHLKLVQKYPALPEVMVLRDARDARAFMRSKLHSSMAEFHAAIIGHVSACIAAGIFRSELDAADAGALVLGIIQSLAMRMMFSRNPDTLVEDGQRLLSTLLVGFMADGERK